LRIIIDFVYAQINLDAAILLAANGKLYE